MRTLVATQAAFSINGTAPGGLYQRLGEISTKMIALLRVYKSGRKELAYLWLGLSLGMKIVLKKVGLSTAGLIIGYEDRLEKRWYYRVAQKKGTP